MGQFGITLLIGLSTHLLRAHVWGADTSGNDLFLSRCCTFKSHQIRLFSAILVHFRTKSDQTRFFGALVAFFALKYILIANFCIFFQSA